MTAVDNSWRSGLPGWFSQASMREDGSVWGYNYSGGYGNLWRGGDLGASHYGQEGKWGFTSARDVDKNPRIWSDYYNNYPDEPIGDTTQPITSDSDAFEKAGKGGSPGQPYDPPEEDPNNPYVPAPKRPIPKIDLAAAGIPRNASWAGEGRPPAPESGMKWYPTTNPNDPGGGFWSPDLNHEKWKVENLGGEIGQIASSEGLQPGILDTNTDEARAAKRQALQQKHNISTRDLETDRRSSGPTLAERLASLDQTIADTTYTTGDKIRDFVGELTKPETYGKAADIINKGANKVWDTLEAPAQGSSKIKETQDWLWNETAVGGFKDKLVDKASGMLGSKAPAAKKFADYLLGDTTTKFSQKEIDDTFKSMQHHDGIVNAPGGIGHGVYGGEDISQLSYNPETNEVTSKFGYQFQKDVDEATGRYNDNWAKSGSKLVRSAIQPLQGQYATDAGKSAVISSPLIQLSKIFGGAHDAGQEITGSFDLLSDPMKKAVKDQYNKRQLKSNKAMIGKSKGNIGGRNVYSIPSF